MNLITEYCAKCRVPLYEENPSSKGRKIFRSFATKFDKDNHEYHLCINCYKGNTQEERKEENGED